MAEDKKDILPQWWNMDIVLAKIISEKLRYYAAHSVSIPGDYDLDSWREKILSIASRLERYPSRFDYNLYVENEIVIQAQEALRELSEIFPSLWD